MKTLRHILGLCALCGLLVSAPAYALGGGGGGGGGGSGGHGAPSEPAPEESMGRSLTHATSYVRMEPVRASPLPVTFHRAIDVTPDPVAALHACARCGVARVLTSGGQPTAALGAATIQRLVETAAAAGYPIVVAAGGGVTESNAAALARATGAPELHGSARDAVRSGMRHRPEPPVHMGGEKANGPDSEFEWRCTSAEKVAGIVAAMRTAR